MRKPVKWLLDLLYPPKCVICGRLLQDDESGICCACLRELPVNTEKIRCEAFVDDCVAPFRYEDALRESLLRYKFGGRESYADFYAGYMAAIVRDKLEGKYELVTWVPISRKRLRERGFDQARLLAKRLAKQLGCPCVKTMKKVKNNPRQARMPDPAARHANVRNAYRAVEPFPAKEKRVLLVDDIVTTGATLTECSGVLLRAGAAQVVCATAASAQSKRNR